MDIVSSEVTIVLVVTDNLLAKVILLGRSHGFFFNTRVDRCMVCMVSMAYVMNRLFIYDCDRILVEVDWISVCIVATLVNIGTRKRLVIIDVVVPSMTVCNDRGVLDRVTNWMMHGTSLGISLNWQLVKLKDTCIMMTVSVVQWCLNRMVHIGCMGILMMHIGCVVVLMMDDMLHILVRWIDQVSGWLVVQMLMLGWIVPQRFAAVGMDLLFEVRMYLFSIDVAWIALLVVHTVAIVLTVMVHWDALNFVVMVIVMVRVGSRNVIWGRVVVGAL